MGDNKRRSGPVRGGPARRWRPGDQFLIVHRDDSVIVVEKQASLLTVRTPTGKHPDLIGLLRDMVGTRGRQSPVLPVHRLDRVVSGLVVTARSRSAQNHLIQQFKAHTVKRSYLAAVDGIVPDDSGTFESHLRSAARSLRMYSDPGEDGQLAITHWRVLERFEQAQATLLEVRLETGVRNQIRAHFSEAGFPLLGERKYLEREEEDYRSSQGTQRIFLHAAELGFVHPDSERFMEWTAALPPELTRWRDRLRRGERVVSLKPVKRLKRLDEQKKKKEKKKSTKGRR